MRGRPSGVPLTRGLHIMGLFTKDIKTMNDLFVHQLQDIYYAEKQLVKALPKMAEKASDPELKKGFLTHLDETKTHVQRLEQVFKMHGAEVKAVDCPAIHRIIEEDDEVAGEVADMAGTRARPQRLRQRPAADLGRGKDHRQEADIAGRRQGQPARRELIRKG